MTTKKKIDFDRANLIGLGQIRQWLPDGKIVGNELTALNPTRNDSKPGSFKINIKSGVWSDFATGDSGSDPVSLFAYLNGVSQLESAKRILDNYDYTPLETKIKKQQELTQILPIPSDTAEPNFTHPELGSPDDVYPYETGAGQVLFYILRFDLENGSKEFRPYAYYKTESGKFQWRWKRPTFENGIPLFGLPTLSGSNERPVVLVEGERKCLKLRKELEKHACVLSICNGAKSADKMDFSSIKDRKVLIWRDNDEPGLIAAKNILQKLDDAKIIQIPAGKPEGWDCADAIDEGLNVFEILGIRPPVQTIKKPFKVLGYDHNLYYFMSGRTRQIIEFSAGGLSTNALLALAPLQYWEDAYPDKSGFNVTQAVNSLIGMADSAGAYDSSRVRGRGAWFDDGRIVHHVGDKLIVDGDPTELIDFESEFIYESRPKLRIDTSTGIKKEEGRRLSDVIRSLNWENPVFGDLLAGWCFVSTVSGAIDWRPHIWLTGAAGSGKTWVLENIVQPLLGRPNIDYKYSFGSASEAGIRQNNGGDSLPIVIDEGEPNEKKMQENLQSLLFLARQSSSESGAAIFKGGKDGRSVQFILRSCWLFTSISVAASEVADKSRITILSLKQNRDSGASERFKLIKQNTDEILTKKFCVEFRARSIRMIPVIRKNYEILSEIVGRKLNSQRFGDQIGTLLAGYFALNYDVPITVEFAEKYLSQHSFDESEQASETRDEIVCINTILGTILKIDGGVSITISELISISMDKQTESVLTRLDAESILRRYGIRYFDKKLYIQNSHPEISRILEKTPYAKNYNLILKRITGATAGTKIRYLPGSIPQRSVEIPIDMIFEE